jgi:uncharacterized membrane protein YagU involved in acid resistance
MPGNAVHNLSAFLAIFWGGILCGVFDITQAIIAFRLQAGLKPAQVLQSVASGLLGKAAYQGGAKTAVLGCFLHFLIAFIWAAFYYIASRYLPVLLERPIVCGLLFGEFVWVVMTFIVLPLSAMHRWPPVWNAASIITGPIGHTVLVGLPIALAVKRYS